MPDSASASLRSTLLSSLNARFAIPGTAQIVAGNQGLPMIRITTASASAEIYLHGAQVTSWRPFGAEEVLFVSGKSRWEDGKAIRGGIPICFPWFRAKADDPSAPAHGLVRTRAWQLDALVETGSQVVVTLSTESDEASRGWWPHPFRIEHRIQIGSELKLELTVAHTGGEDAEPMRFEEALHTYFAVGDATRVRVTGLDEVSYLDNMDGGEKKLQQGDVVYARQTDSAYLDTWRAVELVDPVLGRRLRTAKENSLSTVIWNPWKEGAGALADLGGAEWQQMACVEASNILDCAVSLDAGRQHRMGATLSVLAYEE